MAQANSGDGLGPDMQSAAGQYLPIAEHGLIGDLRTAALVGADGRIDWFCCPRFDSPSVFGSILDAANGGHWTISPSGPITSSRQFYLPDSNVLITRFFTDSGVAELQDFMPLCRPHDPDHRTRIVRRVVAVRGAMDLSMTMEPRFDYGRQQHTAEQVNQTGRLCGGELTLRLKVEPSRCWWTNTATCTASSL